MLKILCSKTFTNSKYRSLRLAIPFLVQLILNGNISLTFEQHIAKFNYVYEFIKSTKRFRSNSVYCLIPQNINLFISFLFVFFFSFYIIRLVTTNNIISIIIPILILVIHI